MPAYIETFNWFVGAGVVLMQLAVVLLAGNLLFFRTHTNPVLLFFHKYTFITGFLMGLGSMVISLFYSSVIGFPPCELCWVQRIFLYPQAILFGMELWKRDRTIINHSLALAFIGSLVSIFHIYVENGGASSLACATGTASEVSCAIRYVYQFSYVTIPVMALTASVFIIFLLVNYRYISRAR